MDMLKKERSPSALMMKTFLVLVIIIMIIVLIVFYLDRQKKRKLIAQEGTNVKPPWTKRIIVEKKNGCNEVPNVRIEKQKATSVRSDLFEYELPLDLDWEFPRQQLKLKKILLGEGSFGRVEMAEAHSIVQEGINTTVAVKMLKEDHTDADMLDLVREMEILKMIGTHVNVSNLLGCCTEGGALLLILPYAPHGNLGDFLRKYRPASEELQSFALQCAKGMEFISRTVIHRDLAARNVLVSADRVIKISDFGLTRGMNSNDYYRKTSDGGIPVKWTALEALTHLKYTTQSDVWSYGILLWEIMTLGATPYPSISSMEQLIYLLNNGYRMEKPPHCSTEVYSIMRDCWAADPDERPTFSHIVEKLEHISTKNRLVQQI